MMGYGTALDARVGLINGSIAEDFRDVGSETTQRSRALFII
jgi:hypothetical protein